MNIRHLLLFNLILQFFDGLISYQLFSFGMEEANPLVAAAISEWSLIWGLLYNKILACVLLLVIFALRHRQPSLAKRGLIATASVYMSVAVACLCEFLRQP